MAGQVESSSTQLKNDKPVVVRVKRKASQSCLDALWLEINERPSKRPLLDFNKLSISESSKKDEELKSRKVFVRHVETVTTPNVSADTLQSFLSASSDALPSREKSAADVKRAFKTANVSSRNAHFEQIRRSEKEKKDFVNDQDEMCRIYDVVRVDVEMKSKVDRLTEMEDCKMMSQFLPLLREFLPNAAMEVEADIHASLSERDMPDDYVYDYYAVEDNMDITMEDAASVFPLVQVDDDDTYYDGPDDSDDESYDSNAENNPLNEYPDEESSDNDDKLEEGSSSASDKSETHERSSNAESEGDDDDDSRSRRCSEADEKDEEYDWSEGGAEFSYEDGEFHTYEDYDHGVGAGVESDHYYDMDS